MIKILTFLIAALLAAFGLLTLFLSSSVIFDLFDIRAKEGNYVFFVVVANFISSVLYLISVYGFILHKRWTSKLLVGALSVLIVAFIGLIIHVYTGGIYETKTIGAMVFRMTLTTVFAVLAYILIRKRIT